MQSLALWVWNVYNNSPTSMHTWEFDVLPPEFWKGLEIKSIHAKVKRNSPKFPGVRSCPIKQERRMQSGLQGMAAILDVDHFQDCGQILFSNWEAPFCCTEFHSLRMQKEHINKTFPNLSIKTMEKVGTYAVTGFGTHADPGLSVPPLVDRPLLALRHA